MSKASMPWTRLIFAAGAALLLGAPASAFAVQVTLLPKTTVEHTAQTGPLLTAEVGSQVPDNLMDPVNYESGTLNFRIDVDAMPGATATGYRICVMQEAGRACTETQFFSATGRIEKWQYMSALEGFETINWTLPLTKVALMVTDGNGTSLGTDVDTGLYLPLSTTVEAVLVETGGTFAGFDSDTPPPTSELGLRGRYYDNTDFTELVDTRIDRPINLFWAAGAPPFEPLGNGWSALWTGQIKPLYGGNYTFCTVNDDGVRLWIDDQLVIDDWRNHGPTENCGQVDGVEEGQALNAWLEYYNGAGDGTLQLWWESDQQAKEIIPEAYLSPDYASSRVQLSLLGGPEDGEVFEHAADPVRLEIRRRGQVEGALTVGLEISGDAEAGADFTGATAQVEIPDGELAAILELTMIDDEVVEGDETITVTITAGDDTPADPPSVTFTLRDNDSGNYGLSGEVRYSGAQDGPIVVEAFRDQDRSFEKLAATFAEAGPFQLDGAVEGLYTVIAFIDANENGLLDSDERWNAHRDDEGTIEKVSLPPTAVGLVIDLDKDPAEAEAPSAGGDDDEGCGCASSGNTAPPLGALLLLVGGLLVIRRRRPAGI